MSILSIDIGGTSIKYALMGKDAVILSRGKIPTPQEGRRELVEAIGRLYDEMPDVEGIAISMEFVTDDQLLVVARESCSEHDTMGNMPFEVAPEDVVAAMKTADRIASSI
jgi:hypothetical protein